MKLPFDLHTTWERVLVWYNAYGERDRRIILGVVVAVGASLLYLAVLEPLLDYRAALAQEIADGQEEYERSMRFIGAKATLNAEREDLGRRLAQAKARLLPGGTGTLGAAALQERANALASEKGIAIQSTQVMKEEVVEPYHKVAVRLTLSGEVKPLAELVSGIEYGQQLAIPFLEVSRRGAVAGAKGPRTLSVTLEVSGFVQSAAAGKGEAADAAEVPAVEAAADAAAVEGASTTTTAAGETTTLVEGTTTSMPSVQVTFPPRVFPTTTLPRVSPTTTLPAAARPPGPGRRPRGRGPVDEGEGGGEGNGAAEGQH